jgi:hypothetical protein
MDSKMAQNAGFFIKIIKIFMVDVPKTSLVDLASITYLNTFLTKLHLKNFV